MKLSTLAPQAYALVAPGMPLHLTGATADDVMRGLYRMGVKEVEVTNEELDILRTAYPGDSETILGIKVNVL